MMLRTKLVVPVRRAVLALVISLLGTAAASALDVRQVVTAVLGAAPELALSEREVESALRGYRGTLLAAKPAFNLEVRPLTYDARRTVAQGPTRGLDLYTISGGLTVGVTQPLPTSGVLTAALGHTIAVQRGDSESLTQVPDLTVQLRQPLFVGSRLISTDAFAAERRLAEIGYELAQTGAAAQRNQTVRNALALLVQVATLQRSEELLHQGIDLLQRQLELARINREQGLISDTTLLALQLPLNTQRSALFDLQLALIQSRQAFARAIGLPVETIERLNPTFNGLLDDHVRELARQAAATQAVGATPLMTANPAVRLRELAVQQSRMVSATRELLDRPMFSIVARAEPAYPGGVRPKTLAASVGDYFSSDPWLNTTVALAVNVPLSAGERRENRRRIDQLSQEIAALQLDDTRIQLRNQLDSLLVNRSFLQERRAFIETDVSYEQQRLRSEEALFAADATTVLAVDQIRLDLLSRRNELWKIDSQLFLNALDILSLSGADVGELLLRR